VSHQEEIPQRVLADLLRPHEHARVALIVLLEIIGFRVRGDHLVACPEGHPNNERGRFRGSMTGDAGEHLPGDFERGSPPGRSLFHFRQPEPDTSDGVEA